MLATRDVIDIIGPYLRLYGVSSWEESLDRPRKDYSACRRPRRRNCCPGCPRYWHWGKGTGVTERRVA